MKKKGLIVATIVMVLVLAVSLTTATYAWFTAQSKASVSSIGFSVTSNSDVLIGVAKTNAYTGSATNDSFVSGDGIDFVPTATEKWTGGNNGLGFAINTGLQLTGLTQAVWSGTGTTGAYVVDDSDAFNAGSPVYVRASGNANSITDGTIGLAIANGYENTSGEEERGDYLDVCFGVKMNKENVTGIALVIGVQSTGSYTTLGMNAAINYTYKLNDAANWGNLTDIYGTNSYSTVKSSMTAPTVTFGGETFDVYDGAGTTPIVWQKGDAVAVIPIAQSLTSANFNDIYQIHLRLFIAGYDEDCVNAAANASANISLNFIATTSTSGT